MADNWATLLFDPAIAEVGGEHTNEGVDYARYLAMALLVDEERKNSADYVFVFEYLQDIALLDSSTAPSDALLIQVKKKANGRWTRTDLCRTKAPTFKGGTPPAPAPAAPKTAAALGAKSCLGKLYLCVHKLSSTVPTRGLFISNAGYDLREPMGSVVADHSRISFEDLHSEDLQHMHDRLTAELELSVPLNLKALSIEQSRVAPAAMRETVRGLLDELLTKQHQHLPSTSGRLQERLLEAFSSRSGVRGGITSIDDVVANKGFTRQAFTSLLQELASVRSASDHLDTIIQDLKTEGMASRSADRIRTEARRLQVLMVREPQTRDSMQWSLAVDAAQKNIGMNRYTDMLEAIEKALVLQGSVRDSKRIQQGEAKAISVLAIMHVDQQPAPIGPKPADQVQ